MRDISDSRLGDTMRGLSGDVMAIELDTPVPRLEETDKHAHQGSFANPIASKEDQDIARPQLQVDSQKNGNSTIGGVNVPNREHDYCLPR